jgi:diacylglycerol kinase (ATP)
MSVILASGPRGQGGVELVPGAKMDDGQLDVLLVEPMSTGELMALMPRVLAGTHLEHPKLQLRQARRVAIATTDWPFVELDNDREGAGSIELGILPGALRMPLPRP